MNQVKTTVSKAVMAGLFQENGWAFQVTKGIPKGAELIKLSYRDGAYELIFQHESLPEVKSGQSIPEVGIEFQTFAVEKPKIIIPSSN